MLDFSIGRGWQAQPAGLDHDFLDFDVGLLPLRAADTAEGCLRGRRAGATYLLPVVGSQYESERQLARGRYRLPRSVRQEGGLSIAVGRRPQGGEITARLRLGRGV